MNYRYKHGTPASHWHLGAEEVCLLILQRNGGSVGCQTLIACRLLSAAKRLLAKGKVARTGHGPSVKYSLPAPPLLPPAQPAG